MLRSALVWALRSPVRLSILAVALLVVGLGLIFVAHQHRPGVTEAGRVAAIKTGPSPEIQPKTEAIEVPPSAHAAKTAARKFLRYYLGHHGGRHRIDAAVRAWVTPQLWAGLRVADPRLLPNEPLSALKARATGAFGADFVARLRDDSTLILSVVRRTKGWVVSDIEPGRPLP